MDFALQKALCSCEKLQRLPVTQMARLWSGEMPGGKFCVNQISPSITLTSRTCNGRQHCFVEAT